MTEQLEAHMPTLTYTSAPEALAWATKHFPHQNSRLIREFPWSTIYQLNAGSQTAYLKIIPHQAANALLTTPVIARHFNGAVPALIASDSSLGLLLIADHDGVQLDYVPSAKQLRTLLTSYADLQIASTKIPDILSTIETLNVGTLLDNFLGFLRPTKTPESGTHLHADYFLDTNTALGYYKAFELRKQLLESLLSKLKCLPITLNHCDLRPRNAAERLDGRCIIYDWDDALIGPVGLSLYEPFNGACSILQLLNKHSPWSGDARYTRDSALLNAYMDRLVEGEICNLTDLQHALPAAACAGEMQYVMTFANFPSDKQGYKEHVASVFEKNLDDLLDICDYFTLNDRQLVFQYAQDYQENGQLARAEHLLSTYVSNHPNDQEVQATLASVWLENGNWHQAAEAYRQMLERQPDDASLHQQIAIALTKNLQADFAIQHFEQALKLDPSLDICRDYLVKALDIQRSFIEAKNPTKAPAVRIFSPEQGSYWEAAEKISMSTHLFEEHGALLIEDLFSVDLVKQIGQLVLSDKYAAYYQDKEHDDALRIGDKRYMVTLDIEGPINTPALYANDFLCRLMRNLLGDDFVLGGLNIAVSIPGADNQWQHRDHPALFPNIEGYENSPSFAIGVLIPLIHLTEAMGTPEIIKGSHRGQKEHTEQMPRQTPIPSLGSCLLMDYRLSHRGLANTSDQIRPMLCLIYHRAWFRDCTNYDKQAAVQISDAEFDKVPDQHKQLFSWIKQ